jgi:hypothetical protein
LEQENINIPFEPTFLFEPAAAGAISRKLPCERALRVHNTASTPIGLAMAAKKLVPLIQ